MEAGRIVLVPVVPVPAARRTARAVGFPVAARVVG
jgi:hypothetical protein